MNLLINCNAKNIPLADGSVNCVVTSPPYYGLRDYGTAKWEGGDPNCNHNPQRPDGGDRSDRTLPLGRGGVYHDICAKCGAVRIDQQIGLEQTPDEYVAGLVQVFKEVKRVLRDDGTAWINLGDSYASVKSRYSQKPQSLNGGKPQDNEFHGNKPDLYHHKEFGLKDKDLIGIPWMVAFALRDDGWYLRQDIIWCLSGGAYLYARTQKGDYPMMVRDVARLDPSTVKLWNGDKWTQVLGWSKSHRQSNELEIVLRSGERISCTPTHKFPTNRGLLEASDLRKGDCLKRVKLPQPDNPNDCAIDNDAAWFAGLYIAEGSRNHGCIQIAGHVKEEERWQRVQKIAAKFGGSAARTIDGNQMNIRVYGKILNALVDHLVTGRTAKDKGFSPTVWQYSDAFINAMLDGYLSGDGSYDNKNNRWRLGFTRNYNLERDLRTACARLGLKLILNLSTVKYNDKNVQTFRGEIRYFQSNHRNRKDENEIVEIRKSRCREVYDIGVEDEPHVFALASGILTHNSKPNPMPESVKDRCTKAHEYIFLLSKSPRYYYDYEAVLEPVSDKSLKRAEYGWDCDRPSTKNASLGGDGIHTEKMGERFVNPAGRNRRSVWTITTSPYKGAHYATFPPKLIEPMILAGCPVGGIVLDPFVGSGTTIMVANQLGRRGVGLDLSFKYLHEDAKKRIEAVQPKIFA